MTRRFPPEDTSIIMQHEPLGSRPGFRRKSWTSSIFEYVSLASEFRTCCLENQRLRQAPYTFAVTIVFDLTLSASTFARTWQAILRRLRRQGLQAFAVLEPSRQERIHAHLIVASQHTERELRAIIDKGMPDRAELPWHKHIERIRNPYLWISYALKAKVSGRSGKGNWTSDIYRSKRQLFCTRLPFKKVYTIGAFWHIPRSKIWARIIQREDGLRQAATSLNLKAISQFYSQLLCEQISAKKLERRLALNCFQPGTRHLIQSWNDQHASEANEKIVDRELDDDNDDAIGWLPAWLPLATCRVRSEDQPDVERLRYRSPICTHAPRGPPKLA